MHRCDLTSINGRAFRDPPGEIVAPLLFLVIKVFHTMRVTLVNVRDLTMNDF